MALSREGRDEIARETYRSMATAVPAPAAGAAAVDKAVEQAQLEAAEAPAAPSEAYAQQVQVVGERAFVLRPVPEFRDGVWTDTTFDPDRMSTVKLPFGSDAFFAFLSDHPQAGRYFAVGERVIVVVDGVAYETVAAGEEPQGVTYPADDEPSTSDLPTTSPPPADVGEAYTTLSANVVEGVAPLTVNFAGRLVGGPDNNRDYYCVESTFEFGDGMVQSAVPGCLEWTPGSVIQREYSASYIYHEPGVYQATFSLSETQSQPLTIAVRDRTEPAADAEPVSTPSVAEPEDASQANSKSATGGLCPGSLGLVILPLVGVVLAARRK
jgi:PKD repeat protein